MAYVVCDYLLKAKILRTDTWEIIRENNSNKFILALDDVVEKILKYNTLLYF